MARAETVTQIPLDRIAAVLGLDPLHFNSIISSRRPERFACDDMFYQHDWQASGRVSRETLAMALKQAEDITARYLGYHMLPKWFQDEEYSLAKPFVPEQYPATGLTYRNRYQSVLLNHGYVLYGGRRVKEYLGTPSILYIDLDGDGYYETAEVTLLAPVELTDPDEVSVYFPGEGGEDRWEIRPARPAISNGTISVRFHRHQVPIPELWEKLPHPEDKILSIDGDDDNNFLTTVDVYRVYRDPSVQAVFMTENCACCTTEPCVHTLQTGCMLVREERLGLVSCTPAVWDAEKKVFIQSVFTAGRQPDKVRVYYRAGYRDRDEAFPNRQMNRVWEQAIIYYAFSLLDDEVCGCDNFNRVISYQREDLASSGPDRNTHVVGMRDLDCPLGTTRAALRLWKLITAPGNRLVTRR